MVACSWAAAGDASAHLRHQAERWHAYEELVQGAELERKLGRGATWSKALAAFEELTMEAEVYTDIREAAQHVCARQEAASEERVVGALLSWCGEGRLGVSQGSSELGRRHPDMAPTHRQRAAHQEMPLRDPIIRAPKTQTSCLRR